MRLPTFCTMAFTSASLLIGVSCFIFSKLVNPSCISCPGEIILNWVRPVSGTVVQPAKRNRISKSAQKAAAHSPRHLSDRRLACRRERMFPLGFISQKSKGNSEFEETRDKMSAQVEHG